MKKTYTVKFYSEFMGTITRTVTAENRRDARNQVEQMAKTMNATEWYFELD